MQRLLHYEAFLHDLITGLPELVLGLLLAIASIVVLLPIARLVIRRLRRRWPRDGRAYGSVIVNAISAMTTLLIIAGALAILTHTIPVPMASSVLWWATAITAVLAIAAAVDRLIVGSVRMMWRTEEQSRAYGGMVAGITHIVVAAAALILILDNAGVSITPLVTSLGIGSVAIALALQDTLANVFSGLYVLIDKPVMVGQFVEIEGGTQGRVDHVSWRSTRIRRLDDNIVVVPNSKIASCVIVNYDMLQGDLSFPVKFMVAYENDLARVGEVAIQAARESLEALGRTIEGHPPLFRVLGFGETGVECAVILRSETFETQFALRHEVLQRLHAGFRTSGIGFAIPMRRIVQE